MPDNRLSFELVIMIFINLIKEIYYNMAGSSDSNYARAAEMFTAVFRYICFRWTTVDRGWKATVIGLLILSVISQF